MKTIYVICLAVLIGLAGAQKVQAQSIAEIASENDDLSTLVEALEAADLIETLSSDGPFTVFAPTNEAFDQLPDGTLDELLMPENVDKLKAVLTYHVIPDKITSDKLSNGQKAKTVQGEALRVDLSSGVMINDASVTKADIKASNGIIHVINKVILPPSM